MIFYFVTIKSTIQPYIVDHILYYASHSYMADAKGSECVYCIGAVDTRNGHVLWTTNFKSDYMMWGNTFQTAVDAHIYAILGTHDDTVMLLWHPS